MGKLVVLTVLGASLALIGERLLTFRERVTTSREIKSTEPKNCHLIEGLENGSEDIDILPSGLAFISTGLKYPGMPNFAPDKPGSIFLMDLNEPNPKAQALEISDGFDKESLNPHGISTFIDKDNTVYLYVVNHPHMDSTVEIFKFEEQQRSLIHLKTIKHELLKSVNDIVVLGPEQFYATRDHYFTSYFLVLLEMIMDFHWTYVLFYSPSEVKVVAQGFSSANGITVSLDQKYVYVADVIAKNMHIMKKHDNWDLTQVKVIQLGTLVDNLTVDPATGDILAGCHPNPMKLLTYNPEDPPGSEVLRIQDALSDNPRRTAWNWFSSATWVPHVEAEPGCQVWWHAPSPAELAFWLPAALLDFQRPSLSVSTGERSHTEKVCSGKVLRDLPCILSAED